jgi:hypothetical protein
VARNDETVFRWDPWVVKSDTLWMTYMMFANTPSVVLYGEPMLDVQFFLLAMIPDAVAALLTSN